MTCEHGNLKATCDKCAILALVANHDALAAENAALRELLNCYNLGGWTDAERLIKERDALAARLADKEILLAEAVEYGTGYKQAYDEAMANYQMALARLAEAEDTIERSGRCLVMSNNGAVEALTILRGYKQPDSAAEQENERG